jgi:hypothetical protein
MPLSADSHDKIACATSQTCYHAGVQTGAQAMYKIRPNTIINYLMAAIRRNPNITDSELRQLPKCVRMQKENNYYIKDMQLHLIRKWMDDPDYIPANWR